MTKQDETKPNGWEANFKRTFEHSELWQLDYIKKALMRFIHQAILSAEKRAKRKAKEEVITDLILGNGNPEYWPDYFPVSKAFKKAYEKFMKPVDYSSSLPDQEQLSNSKTDE